MGGPSGVGTPEKPLRVAVIGSGPSGFFAAVALLKQTEHAVEVDVFDRLPTPYGLVRGGVAPDHQKMKSVTRVYEKSALMPGFRFFGHVELGRDVSVEDLRQHYHQIVYAVGNEQDRRMGIPGEPLLGCTPATVFVGWYNAHPDYREAYLDFSCKRIAVVGNGNVAVDVARILAKTPEELESTDIAEHALEALRDSQVEEIVVLGRRGPVQASFTPVELRELTHLPHTGFVIDPAELELDEHSRAQLEQAGESSPTGKNFALFEQGARTDPAAKPRNVRLRFCVSPAEILGDEQGRVRALRLERNELVQGDNGSIRPRGTGEFEDLDVGWIFVSIGYQGRRLPDIPFDEKRGVIDNRDGRIFDSAAGQAVPGEYVVGWAKSGPRGLIGIHKKASSDVAALMLEDLVAGNLAGTEDVGDRSIVDLLDRRGVHYVTFAGWKRIDESEVERGKERGAPRVKYSTVDDMLDLGRSSGGD